MANKRIPRSGDKEYDFLTAWESAIDNKDVIITSKKSGIKYKIDMMEKNNKLKYYNPVIKRWQACTFIEPKEIFNDWFITKQ